MIKDSQIVEIYNKTGSIWRAGEFFGISGQQVCERLKKLGIARQHPPYFSEHEIALIENLYRGKFMRGDGKLRELSEQIGRHITGISYQARKLGFTTYYRKLSPGRYASLVFARQKYIEENGYPKGMLGKFHDDKAKSKISLASFRSAKLISKERRAEINMKILKTRLEKHGSLALNHRYASSWKCGWRVIGGRRKFYRSRWEANYARFLEFLRLNGEIKKWEHEPETFWFEKIKRGRRSYTPDFRVTYNDDTIIFHEVKGWMDPASKTKLKRMRIYHPEITIRIINEKWFKANRNLSGVVKEWE